MGMMSEEMARKVEAEKKYDPKTEFFLKRIGKQLTFFIGKSSHHVAILFVDPKLQKFRYKEEGMPETWMSLENVDSYHDFTVQKSA